MINLRAICDICDDLPPKPHSRPLGRSRPRSLSQPPPGRRHTPPPPSGGTDGLPNLPQIGRPGLRLNSETITTAAVGDALRAHPRSTEFVPKHCLHRGYEYVPLLGGCATRVRRELDPRAETETCQRRCGHTVLMVPSSPHRPSRASPPRTKRGCSRPRRTSR